MRGFLIRLARSLKPLWRNQRGNVLLITAAGMPMMIGGAGFGVDMTQWYLWKRELQTAVDSAAMAGAFSRLRSQDVGANANDELARNVDVATLTSQTVTLGSWPTNSAANNAVTVTAATQRALPFSSMFSSNPPTIRRSATAALIVSGRHCMVSLDRSSTDTTVTVQGNALLRLGCGISSNASSALAINLTGSAGVEASPISAVGGINANNSNLIGTSTIRPYAPEQEDPFAGLTAPANPTAGTMSTSAMTAGTYSGGFTINSNRNVTMAPGLYVFDGGTYRVNGNASLIGHGVTIVLKNGATLDLNGGSTIDLRAPTAAGNGVPTNLVGMVIYDADPPNAAISLSRINGNNTLNLSGAVYMPRQNVEISGNADPTTNCLLLITNRITVSGSASIVNNCTGTPPYAANTNVTAVRLVK